MSQHSSLVTHLTELRSRLVKIVAAIGLFTVVMLPFSNELYEIVSQPLKAYLPEGASMIATEVASPFLTPFKLTMVLALFAAMPVILYQIWGFIAPGLYRKEKNIVAPLLISSVLLFYAGMAFAYFLVFPLVFSFFTSVAPDGVAIMTDINQYLSFVLKLLFAFGIAFEIPVALVLLAWMNIIDASKLPAKRPYIIVLCFVLGMLLTPPDVISQTLLAVPMWGLFELGTLVAKRVQQTRPQQQEDA